jgi:hypothetical protein
MRPLSGLLQRHVEKIAMACHIKRTHMVAVQIDRGAVGHFCLADIATAQLRGGIQNLYPGSMGDAPRRSLEVFFVADPAVWNSPLRDIPAT